jgi:membrane protein YqaA with SNARE-associated domain
MKQFGAWLAASVSTLGPWGIFWVALGDSAFVPMPQGVDALLIAQSIAAPSTAWLAASLAVAGSTLGSSILYAIARRGGRSLLAKRMTPEGFAKLERRTREYGALALIPSMTIPLPLPTKLFVLAAGAFQMSPWSFVAATAFGRSVRYFGEAALALRYREETTAFLKDNALTAAGIALALIVVFLAINRWSRRRVVTGA